MNLKYILAGALFVSHFVAKGNVVSDLEYEFDFPSDLKVFVDGTLENSFLTFIQPIILKNKKSTAVTISSLNLEVYVENARLSNISIPNLIRISENGRSVFRSVVRIRFSDLPFAVYSALLASKGQSLSVSYSGFVSVSSVRVPVKGSQIIPIKFK